MLRWVSASAALIFAAPALAAITPDPRLCPKPVVPEAGERERTKPLPVPRGLHELLGSSLYHYALSTLGGGRICIDTSWTESVEDIALTPDERFLSFRWYGYETYGYKLVDRTGRGQVIEIGAQPFFSPTRRLVAAIDQTESEFGSLSGLAVWRVTPTAVVEVARIEDIPRLDGWRIDGWVEEECLNLSAQRAGQDPAVDRAKALRDRFVARPYGKTWRVQPVTATNRFRGR